MTKTVMIVTASAVIAFGGTYFGLVQDTPTRSEVRVMINEKSSPIREDVARLENKVEIIREEQIEQRVRQQEIKQDTEEIKELLKAR